ncbi:MAG: ABC transporter substrate-binding protein [Candidatus Rokubacteria bacterium]|nr:ABC transporter substrate-binding protein [Candidatus Rokubacteria bacterium]
MTIRLVILALAVALALSTTTAVAAPPAGRVVRVGLLYVIAPTFDPETQPAARELVAGLREQGYVLGKNLVIEFRSAEGHPERIQALAAELIAAKVEMLLIPGTQGFLVAREMTKTVPLVMVGTADPVETGLVASLARPGGNITGIAINAAEIAAKRVQLLQEAVPKLARVAVLWNSSFKSMTLSFQQIEQAAPQLGVIVQSIRVAGSEDFEKAFAAMTQTRPGGLVVLFGPLHGNDLPRIVEFVTKQGIPAVFERGQGIRGGGLMEFGANAARLSRRVGAYVDKIANGVRPGDIPVEEPSEFELVINMKAAKAMGLTIPPALRARANQVVE